jgi:hypothetical protein
VEKGGLAIAASRLLAPNVVAGLALLVCGCSMFADCIPPRDSAERVDFRARLGGLVHVYQCLGPPTPTGMQGQEAQNWRRKSALLVRIRNSRLAEDLEQAIRDDAEFSRNVNEAECVVYDWEKPDSPSNVAEFRSRLEGERKQIAEAEAIFDRLIATCGSG